MVQYKSSTNLRYNLSLNKHLQTKLESAISAINANSLDDMCNPKMKLFNKFKIFDTAAKAIMFYGTQVCGVESYEIVVVISFFYKENIFST